MTTTNWMDRLSEYLDDTLTPAERAACEAWLASSAEGQELLQELRRVVARAKTLPDVAVPEAVWAGIQQGIAKAPVAPASTEVLPLRPAARGRSNYTPFQLAAAAVVLLAIGIGFGLKVRTVRIADPGSIATNRPRNGGVTTGVRVTLARHADASYDKAVEELQIILDQNRGAMDTATVRVLESSLARIDAALADAQKALESDPHSAYLNDHLSRIKRKKLDLLRQGASLVQAS
ncbi:MAG: hypothetical protein JF590_02100 [Gemmatimonadetes bacterium]|nr:hypothetical protein [Gemmatimonadota bacterium]